MSYKMIAIAFLTLVRKEVNRFIRIWPQTLIPPLVTAILYFIIFGHVIGKRIGLMHGVPYIQFIVPGMVMMQVIMLSYINTSSSVFGAKFSKSIEEILVSSMPNQVILLSYTLASLLRAGLVGILVTLLAAFFVKLRVQHWWIMLVTVLLTALLFSTLGMINSLYAKKFDDISIAPSFILTPLIYLGGVFYSIKSLPPFWQHLSMINPVVYMIDTFRYSMLGISSINIDMALSVLFVITLVVYLLCLYLLRKGVGLRT